MFGIRLLVLNIWLFKYGVILYFMESCNSYYSGWHLMFWIKFMPFWKCYLRTSSNPNAQMKGSMCIEWPFNGSGLEMKKFIFCKIVFKFNFTQEHICLLFSASPFEYPFNMCRPWDEKVHILQKSIRSPSLDQMLSLDEIQSL